MKNEMTPRERVTRTVEFTGPDRIPVMRAIFPGAFINQGQKLVDFLNTFPDDFTPKPATMPEPEKSDADVIEYTDEWGCVWKRFKGYTVGEVVKPPLETWDAFASYKFPDPPPPKYFDDIKQQIESNNHAYYTFGYGPTFFERMQFLRKTQNLYMDIGEDRAELYELADRMVDYFIDALKKSIQAGVDGCHFADDWGTQISLLINPKFWRSFFKPRYKKMFDVVKNGGAHVWFHTDGYTYEILDDLIEIGVDVINPQHHIMGNKKVADKIAGRVCLRSDLDRQHIIPHGTKEEIENHVKEIIKLFGNFNGGLVLHGEVGPDVPFENIVNLYNSFEKYGKYPLDWIKK